MQIKVKMKGGSEFDHKMRRLYKELKNTAPLHKSLGIEVVKWIKRNYALSGGLLKGDKWPPLAKSTIASRRRGSSKPLLDTGQILRDPWFYGYSARRTEVGHNKPDLMKIHDEGTGPYTIKPKKRKALRFVASGFTVGKHGKAAKRSKLKYAFAKYVNHPGIPRRRQVPHEDEIMPQLIRTADVWLEKAEKKANL